jgi:transglutaminase-like putative cysteine protease
LKVVARSRVEILPRPKPAGRIPAWETVRDACTRDALTVDTAAGEFLHESHHVRLRPAFATYAGASFTPGRPILDALVDFVARIHRDFRFDPRATTIATPVDEVFTRRRGVCQDFAHLGISCLRSLGIPARYVSGYIETTPPPGKPRLVGADASHAWVAVWCGSAGWIDADPTNNVLPDERHITTAWGRDYADVSPLRGVVVGGGEHKLDVGIDVERLQQA